jgi:hypothetical protein
MTSLGSGTPGACPDLRPRCASIPWCRSGRAVVLINGTTGNAGLGMELAAVARRLVRAAMTVPATSAGVSSVTALARSMPAGPTPDRSLLVAAMPDRSRPPELTPVAAMSDGSMPPVPMPTAPMPAEPMPAGPMPERFRPLLGLYVRPGLGGWVIRLEGAELICGRRAKPRAPNKAAVRDLLLTRSAPARSGRR